MLHRGRGLSTVAAHPMGIRALHPQADLLTMTLEPEPYAIAHWARSLLPVDPGPGNEMYGAGGLRYTTTNHHVLLAQLGTGAHIKLNGFPVRLWERAAAAVEAQAFAIGEPPCSAARQCVPPNATSSSGARPSAVTRSSVATCSAGSTSHAFPAATAAVTCGPTRAGRDGGGSWR